MTLFLDTPTEIKFADPEDEGAGTITGYASVFGLVDRVGDIVEAGAFKATLADWRKRKAPVPMLWQHDMTNPIGVWTDLKEDDKGLKVTGSLILDVPQAKAARALCKAGAVGAMSIGYRSSKDAIDRTTGVRMLKAVDLYEISLVTFPAMPEARIDGVKDAGEWNPRELEAALREGGLSRSEAVKAVAIFRKHTTRDASSTADPPRDAGLGELLMTIRRATESRRV